MCRKVKHAQSFTVCLIACGAFAEHDLDVLQGDYYNYRKQVQEIGYAPSW